MAQLLWENGFLNARSRNALQQYTQIGESLEGNPTILNLKEKLKMLPSGPNNIRSFLAYILPSLCGKTQSVFSFGLDLMPIYIPLNTDSNIGQPIYEAFRGNKAALHRAYTLDYESLRLNTDPAAIEFVEEYRNNRLYTLGLLNSMIQVGEVYKNNTEGISWMEYLARSHNIQINPISLIEFLNLYPLDTELGVGLVSSKLEDYALVLDEYPSIQDIPENRRNHRLLTMVRVASFVRNLARAIGISIMVMGTNSNTYNLVARDAATNSRTMLNQPDYINRIWCTVFVQCARPSIEKMLENSNCARFFDNGNINHFRYGLLGVAPEIIRPFIYFVTKQVKLGRPGLGIFILLALADLIDMYVNEENRVFDINFIWSTFCSMIVSKVLSVKNLSSQLGVLGNFYLMTLISPQDIPKREKTFLINSHFFYLEPPSDCIDTRDQESCFYLYNMMSRSGNLKYRKVDAHLSDWLPEVRSPVAEKEFFLYLSSWGYFNIPDSDIRVATDRPIAQVLKDKIEAEFNRGQVQSRHPSRDWIEFENLCLTALCNASHSGSFSSVSVGIVFIKELVAHLIADNIEIMGEHEYLHESITFKFNPPIDNFFDESMAKFEIPYLGSANKVWHRSFVNSLSDMMAIGNMTYLPNAAELDISFDIFVSGRFHRNGGALEAKFRDTALRYSDLLKYLTGPKTRRCPLVIIACAMAPKRRSTQQSFRDLCAKANSEQINIFIIRHARKSSTEGEEEELTGSRRRFIPYEDSIEARELEVQVLENPTSDPKRVLIVIEAFFPIPRR